MLDCFSHNFNTWRVIRDNEICDNLSIKKNPKIWKFLFNFWMFFHKRLKFSVNFFSHFSQIFTEISNDSEIKFLFSLFFLFCKFYLPKFFNNPTNASKWIKFNTLFTIAFQACSFISRYKKNNNKKVIHERGSKRQRERW